MVSRNGSEPGHKPMMEGAALQAVGVGGVGAVFGLSSFGEEKTEKEVRALQGLAEGGDQPFSPR